MDNYIKMICWVFWVDKLKKDLNDDLENILEEIFSNWTYAYNWDKTFVELCAENWETAYIKIKWRYQNADWEVILETDELKDFILFENR